MKLNSMNKFMTMTGTFIESRCGWCFITRKSRRKIYFREKLSPFSTEIGVVEQK